MNKITRRLLAMVLCVMLALTPPLAAAQDAQAMPTAQVLITLADGTQLYVPAQLVTTTLGDSVYWVDQSMMTEEQRIALAMGQLVLMNELGEVIWQQPLDSTGMGVASDMPVQVADPNAPENAFTVVLGDMLAMPMSPEEADMVLGGFGYMTPAPEVTEPEVTEPEITEPEVTEPEITEPEITEPEITEPEVTEPEITEPEVTEPEITEPEITEPEVTEPEITEPEVTEPEITEPEITEPEIIEPEITEPEEIEVDMPTYVTPLQDGTNLRSEPYKAEETFLIQVGLGDVLEVFEYHVDENGAIWWSVYDYRTESIGYIMADVVAELDNDSAYSLMDAIDEELYAEEEPEVIEPEVTEPEITEPEVTEPEITEPEITEPEVTEPEITEPETTEPEVTEPEITEPEITEPEVTEPEITEPETTEPEITEPETTEPEVTEPEITEPEVTEPERSGYAVTNGKNNANNLRSEPNAKDPISFENGELVLLGDTVVDSDNRLWYAVTVIRTGDVGYMRDYLLKEISMDEAVVLLEQIAQEQAKEEPEVTEPEETEPEETEPEETEPEETEPEVTEPEETEPEITEPEITEPEVTEPEVTEPEVTEPEDTEPEETEPEIIEPEVTEPEETEPEITEPEETEPEVTEPEETEPEITESEETETQETEQEELPSETSVYALTLAQDNGAAIVLVEAPGANPPASGSVTLITQPTPLLVLDETEDDEGNTWYLVQNMCAGDSGYIPAYKVEEVSREEAEAAIYEVSSGIAPYEPPVEETEEPEENAEPTPTPTAEPTPTPEPEEPQELVEGDVGHYGRTNNKQVNFRKAPNSKDAWGKLAEGTPLYVISNDGVWCTARAEVNGKMRDGAIMSEFVTLMGVNEEIAYAATLENPEVIAPVEPTEEPTAEPTEAPTEEPTAEPTAEPTEEPTAEPEPTEPAEPQVIETYAIVTYDYADVRSNTDSNSALQTRLPIDTPVYVRQQMPDDEGTIWCDIIYGDNEYGYMMANKLRLMTEGEVAAYLESLNTPTPSPEPTPTPVPTATPEPQELRIYARVLQNGTPLRGNPDNMAYLQTILDEGKVVYIFQSQVASDGMTWYLVQYSGQWGFIRADLVRLMGEEETSEYLAALEAEMATPTPMPQVTPEPVGPDSTSAYAKLIKDAVNLRRTPSTSGTSLGRIARNTLMLVTGEENDGTYTWYQVDYNGQTGYVRSDMAQMLTIAELQAHLAEQAKATPVPNAGVSTTPNSSNNVSHVINGSPLQDLIPVDDSWTNNIISGMPSYATATPDPNATPSPAPVQNPASLISSFGTLTVNGVPAVTEDGEFEVYGKTAAFTAVKATVDVTVDTQTVGQSGLIASAVAESGTTRKYTVGETVSDANGDYTMDVKLPQEGEYIVEFTSGNSYARYGVTYESAAGAEPAPTAAPLPTAEPVVEEGGFGLMPILIGGLLIVVAAVVYGVYIYMRRREEEEEEEVEDEVEELLRERMNQQRIRSAQQSEKPAAPLNTGAPRMPQSQAGQIPSYMRNMPDAPKAPSAPQAPVAPVKPQAPAAPQANPYARPTAPQAPKAPVAPVKPQAPAAPKAPEASAEQNAAESPRRRRRPPVDPNA